MSRLVYKNGQLVPEKDATISIFDSALMFGDMVFEMTRSFNKRQFKLEDHLERLLAGVKILRIPLGRSLDELVEICNLVVDANDPFFDHDDEHRLMINVSRGPLGIYHEVFDGNLQPTLIVADFPLKWTVAGMGELYDKGINAVVTSQRAIPAHLMDPKIKNRSRLFYQMANIEASQFKGERNWALLLDPDGNVTEGTGDNFFIVKDAQIITSRPENVLRGVSRAYIFELARQLDLEVLERDFGIYDVYTADEAFMTGTPFSVLPVSSLNSLPIGDHVMGPVTSLLIKKWGDNVGVDLIRQIKTFNERTAVASATSPYRFVESSDTGNQESL